MKNLMIIGTLLALSPAAHAGAPVTCTTNIRQDPHLISTTFTINSNIAGQTLVTVQTGGGVERFKTAPKTFPVAVQSRGPEAVEYFNNKEDFELTVHYQPINGRVRGIFTGEILGRRVQAPVICFVAQPVMY